MQLRQKFKNLRRTAPKRRVQNESAGTYSNLEEDDDYDGDSNSKCLIPFISLELTLLTFQHKRKPDKLMLLMM